MAVTATTIPAPVQNYFSMKLLAFPVPNMIHSVPATQKIMEANSGRTIRFRRYNRLNPALVPLGPSGQTPPSQTPTIVDIDATISFYGSWIAVNEQPVLQNQDPKKYGISKLSLIDLEAYGIC